MGSGLGAPGSAPLCLSGNDGRWWKMAGGAGEMPFCLWGGHESACARRRPAGADGAVVNRGGRCEGRAHASGGHGSSAARFLISGKLERADAAASSSA